MQVTTEMDQLTAKANKARKAWEELDRLIANLDPKADLPCGFGLWAQKLQVYWLKQHQKGA